MLFFVMVWYVMLCVAMVCYVMLCYVMLFYFMLCYVMLCYFILFYVMLLKAPASPQCQQRPCWRSKTDWTKLHLQRRKKESSENLKRDLRFSFKIDPTSWISQNSNVLHLQQKWHVWWDVSGKLCWIWTQMLKTLYVWEKSDRLSYKISNLVSNYVSNFVSNYVSERKVTHAQIIGIVNSNYAQENLSI